MSEIPKSIRMPEDTFNKWLTALRSGEYKQATDQLEMAGGYCCLGVLQHVLDGDVERYADGGAMGTPTKLWQESKGIELRTISSLTGGIAEPHDGNPTVPQGLCPQYPTLLSIAELNDETGLGFAGIADVLEKITEVY